MQSIDFDFKGSRKGSILRLHANDHCPCAGFVQRRFIWPLLFAPLWGSLFISFGIGPIVTRTEVSHQPPLSPHSEGQV